MATRSRTEPRIPLTKARVFEAAVALADREGIEAVSMRRLGQELGVEAMSLYNHVANKEEVLDGMVDVVVGEIAVSAPVTEWKTALRQCILSARASLLRHPWASAVIVTRTSPTPTMLGYMDSILGILRGGGFSVDLTHHAVHVLGSRMLGFAQELFDDSDELAETPELVAVMMQQMATVYPHITELAMAVAHDEATVVGTGCDDQFEFEFGLDLILDGLERLASSDRSDASVL